KIDPDVRHALFDILVDLDDMLIPADYEPTAATLWEENILSFMIARIKFPGEEPHPADTYDPDVPRPTGFIAALQNVSTFSQVWDEEAGDYVPVRDARFPFDDPARPPQRVIEAGPAFPGGWVAEADILAAEGQEIPKEHIRGLWKVADDGQVTAFFTPNPDYRPEQRESN
ncbi:MAG: hypothetical protein LBI99_05820, partial [Propionibacteriaceae bacterium]|nr:hypothetical protein [Propionibacteriaceae bacterium]